jgi:hypothetical protein
VARAWPHRSDLGALEEQFALTQDAVLRVYQTLALYYADQSQQAWSGANYADRETQRTHQASIRSGICAFGLVRLICNPMVALPVAGQ